MPQQRSFLKPFGDYLNSSDRSPNVPIKNSSENWKHDTQQIGIPPYSRFSEAPGHTIKVGASYGICKLRFPSITKLHSPLTNSVGRFYVTCHAILHRLALHDRVPRTTSNHRDSHCFSQSPTPREVSQLPYSYPSSRSKRATMIGETMLHLAAFNGHHSIVEAHLNRGANINARNGKNKTLLHLAAMNGQEAVVQLLLHWGANKDMRIENGKTAWDLAMDGGYGSVADLLGLSCAPATEFGETSLHLAAVGGDCEIIRGLLDGGTNVDARDGQGKTALHLAVEGGHLEAVNLLFDRGADVNTDIMFGETALHLAARNGRLEIIPLLLERGARVTAGTEDGKTALHFAAIDGHHTLIPILLHSGAATEAKTLIGETALHLAALNAHECTILVLLDEGAAINARTRLEETALHIAVKQSCLVIILALLHRGADITARPVSGMTTLDLAVNTGNTEAIKAIRLRQAEIDAEKESGQLPCHKAGSGQQSGKKQGVVHGILKAGKKAQVCWNLAVFLRCMILTCLGDVFEEDSAGVLVVCSACQLNC